jgi:hypothetical protein
MNKRNALPEASFEPFSLAMIGKIEILLDYHRRSLEKF